MDKKPKPTPRSHQTFRIKCRKLQDIAKDKEFLAKIFKSKGNKDENNK